MDAGERSSIGPLADATPLADALPPGLAELAPGSALAAALADVRPQRLTAHQLVVLIAAILRQIAFLHAMLLSAVRELGFAPPGERERVVRDPERNPFAGVEAAFGATWTAYRCEQFAELAQFALVDVPELGRALAEGRVDLDKLKVFHRALSGVVDLDLARELAAEALTAAGRDNTATLRTRLARLLAKRDPDSMRKRRQRDHEDRFVDRFPEPGSGLVMLQARFCDEATAAAAYAHIDDLAQAAKAAGDPAGRTIDQLRHDILLDLAAGVNSSLAGHAAPTQRKGTIILHLDLATLVGIRGLLGRDAVAALATVNLARLDQARHEAHLDQTRVDQARLNPARGNPDPANPGVGNPGGATLAAANQGDETPGAGNEGGAADAIEAGGCGQCWQELADLVDEPAEIAGYGPVTAHIARQVATQLAAVSRWRYAVSDGGQVIAEGALPKDLLPELMQHMRRWAVDASAGPDGRGHYRPTAAQLEFVRARDRRCRAPGCRVSSRRCEVDHRVPWHRGGPTIVDNLFCLCKRHHRAKDAGGHRYAPTTDGVEWTTAAGHRYRALREEAKRCRHRRHRRC